jgi:hypothetical protein
MEQEPYFEYKEPIQRSKKITVPVCLEDGTELDPIELSIDYYIEDDVAYISYMDDYGDAHPDDVNHVLYLEFTNYQIL